MKSVEAPAERQRMSEVLWLKYVAANHKLEQSRKPEDAWPLLLAYAGWARHEEPAEAAAVIRFFYDNLQKHLLTLESADG